MTKRDHSEVAFVAFVVVAIGIAATLESPYYAGLLAYASVLGIFALSVNLVFGYLGYVTFGHAAFLGLGAYTAGLLTTYFGWNYWTTLPLALLPGACVGALVGFASLRLGGAYFAIASLTVAEVFRLVAANWIDLTRGPLGIVVTPSPLPGSGLLGGIGIQEGYLGATLILTGVAVFIVFRLMRGPHGRAWTAIRQSLALAEAIGIPTLRYRVANIAFSGALASLAGFLLVPKIFVLTPDLFGPNYSATGLLAVILGGKGTVVGPLIGGAVFAVLPETLRVIEDVRLAVFALLLLIIVWALPGGVISLLRRGRVVRSDATGTEKSANLQMTSAAYDETHRRPPLHPGSILEVDRLSKSFEGLRALREVSFHVAEGEILGLIGPNGAGKTTCLNLLCGSSKPDSGNVRFIGTNIGGWRPHRTAKLGIGRTFQQTTLFGDLTARENALIATYLLEKDSIPAAILRTSSFRSREARRLAAADEALRTVGLLDRADAIAGKLAYGEQRMLAIALALVTRPKLLLLDEPAAGLNQTEAAQLAQLLSRLRDRGMTIVIIDHNLRMIMSVCDRVVVLHHGEKLADATPREVRSDPQVIQAYLGQVEPEAAHA